MSITRSKRTKNFTILNNDLINDEMLDWKDLGLLVYLLSKPDNWSINAEHLAKVKSMGIKGIYTGLKAICDAGYASKKPNPKGGWDWIIYDEPQDHRKPQNMPNSYFGSADNRNAEIRNAENGRLINTNIQQELREKQELKDITANAQPQKPEKQKLEKTIDTDLSINELDKLKPEEVDQELWTPFLTARKKRKAVQTERAINAAISELNKCVNSGISMNEAIKIYLVETWRGIDADWVIKKKFGNNFVGNKQPTQRPIYEYTPSREKLDMMKTIDGEVLK